ncbi:MAG: hypothetical protein CL610_28310 [Anaerolineaceae bacterium]|nr:hypothetical protein [Anaerolineaceae bacterium]
MYYQVDFDEELRQVQRAVTYYQDSAAALRNATDLSDEIRNYYRGMLVAPDSPALRFRSLFFAMRLQPVLSYMQQCEQPPRILDLGCGYGLESRLLSMAGAHVYGVDYSADKIAEARRQQATYEAEHGTQLPLRFDSASLFDFEADEPFDAVYSSATLHHIEPARQAVQVIARLLKPGGWFFLSDENGFSPVQQLAVQQRIGWTSSRHIVKTNPQTGQTYEYGRENIRPPLIWRRHMTQAGLKPEFIKYCRLLPSLNWPLERLVQAERTLRNMPVISQLLGIGFLLAARKPLPHD